MSPWLWIGKLPMSHLHQHHLRNSPQFGFHSRVHLFSKLLLHGRFLIKMANPFEKLCCRLVLNSTHLSSLRYFCSKLKLYLKLLIAQHIFLNSNHACFHARALKFGRRKPLNQYQHTVAEKAFPCLAHAPTLFLLLFTTEAVVEKQQQQQPPLTRPSPVVAHCVHYYPGFPQQLLG